MLKANRVWLKTLRHPLLVTEKYGNSGTFTSRVAQTVRKRALLGDWRAVGGHREEVRGPREPTGLNILGHTKNRSSPSRPKFRVSVRGPDTDPVSRYDPRSRARPLVYS